jgi:hypothetical protein
MLNTFLHESKKIVLSLLFLSVASTATLCANALPILVPAPVPIPEQEILWGRLLPQSAIYHYTNFLAWNGVRQTDKYDPSNSFYHTNGSIAWDGMKRTINTWGDPSDRGIFYYDNGQEAWGGIQQKLNTWGDHHKQGIFYHRDGNILWTGVEQKISTWGDSRNAAYVLHTNGEKAWGGLKQRLSHGSTHTEGNVYHDNGQLAWSGLKGSPVYDSSGLMMVNNADYIYLHLGYNCWLYVDYTGNFKITLHLGEGYTLHTSAKKTFLELYQLYIELE